MISHVLSALLFSTAFSKRLEVPDIHQRIPITSNFNPVQSRLHDLDDLTLALEYAKSFNPSEFVVKSEYETVHNKVRHVYLKQMVNGLEIANGDMNLNILDGKVMSYGSSFYNLNVKPEESLSYDRDNVIEAVRTLAKAMKVSAEGQVQIEELVPGRKFVLSGLDFATEPVQAELAYLQTSQGQSLELVWNIVAPMEDNTLNAFVSVSGHEVLEVIDWVADAASYRVYNVGINDPADGAAVRSVVTENKFFAEGSPNGWHNDGKINYNTRGNNVAAQTNPTGGLTWETNYRPQSANLVFDYPVDFTKAPSTYQDAAVTNLFYMNNIMHDFAYAYGMDERAGSFQQQNFGKGGLENDAVIANAQDGSGTNNANFMTPPDGQKPRMRMYTWNTASPARDGDLDNGIIIHEYGHGISNRLTGGPLNVNCLGVGEGLGMGEGWGDFFGLVLRQKPGATRFTNLWMGSYSLNQPAGIRKYPYSTDMKANPETYAYIVKPEYSDSHYKGEIWANILFECYWNLVDSNGFDPTHLPGSKGNGMMMQDVFDGMKIQPCNPDFVSARNAILQADQINYQGKNLCGLWRGFAKRGLGLNAGAGGKEDYTVPAGCLQFNDMRSRPTTFQL